MRNLLSAAMIVIFSGTVVFAQQSANVAGKWDLTVQSPQGAILFALQLKQDGSKISGTAELEGKAQPLTGSVHQKQISFSFATRHDATLAFKGVVDGDRMSGTVPSPHGGDLPWKAARSQQAATKPILGTVTAFKVDSLEIGIKPDTGNPAFVKVGPETEVVRVAPGDVGLKSAQPAKITDLALGDRVLVSFAEGMPEARRIVVISATDIAKRDDAERQDWQQRGVSGIVTSKNGREVLFEARSMAGTRTITVTMTGKTVYRRYAPDSVKFADARPSTLDEILKGDQVQARGEKSADGLRLTAEEVVSGTFLTRMGRITAINAATPEITIRDAATKQPVTVKFTQDSKLKKMPDFAAILGGKSHGANGGPPHPPELSQMLARLAPAGFEDLKLGGSVIVSSTKGASGDSLTAIMLLANADFIVQMMHPETVGQAGSHSGISAEAFRARHGGLFGPGGLSLPAIIP